MNERYKRGFECFVYLGEGTGHDGNVDSLANWVSRLCQLQTMLNPRRSSTLFEWEVVLGERCPWRCCLKYIMKQPYLTRTWVLQEIYCSNTVTCLIGESQLPWETVKALAIEIPLTTGIASNAAADEKMWRTPDNLSDLNAWSSLWEPCQTPAKLAKAQALINFTKFINIVETVKDRSLLYLLRSARSLKATDPRDKVFALLNLANDRLKFPPPNYALKTEEVYRLFAQALADGGCVTEILSMSLYHNKHSLSPSWVPRWDDVVPEFNFEMDTRFNAGGGRTSLCRWSPENLRVKAYSCDRIQFRSATLRNATSLFRNITSFIDAFVLEAPYPARDLTHASRSLNKDIAHLLFCDPHDNGPHVFRQKSMGDNFGLEFFKRSHGKMLHDVVTHGSSSERRNIAGDEHGAETLCNLVFGKGSFKNFKNGILKISPTEECLRGVAQKYIKDRGSSFLNFLRAEIMPLCIVVTTLQGESQLKRRLGLAPAICRPGDRVFIVKGARAPFIFRKCGPNQYQNLGQAYVRGVMNGEVIEKLDRDDFQYIEIV